MLHCILFFLCTLVGTWSAHAATTAPVPTLSPRVQELVDRYSSPATYDAFMAKGEAYIERFNDAAFIDHIIHAEEYRRDSYLDWYSTPCFAQTGNGFRPALQKGDLAFAGVAGAGWGLEWLLYKSIHEFFVRSYYQQLQHADDVWDENFFAYKQKQHWAQLIAIAAATTLVGLAFSHTTKNIYFDLWLGNDQKHPSLVHTFAGPFKQHVLQAINPQTWFDTCNEWLDYFGCVPDWSKTTATTFSKALLCNLAGIIWYERTVLAPQWQRYCHTLQINALGIKQQFTTPEQQHAFLTDALNIPFITWLKNRYCVTAFCNTCISGLFTLIAAGNAYYKLQPMLQETSCSETP